jgi:hypothetical protein
VISVILFFCPIEWIQNAPQHLQRWNLWIWCPYRLVDLVVGQISDGNLCISRWCPWSTSPGTRLLAESEDGPRDFFEYEHIFMFF